MVGKCRTPHPPGNERQTQVNWISVFGKLPRTKGGFASVSLITCSFLLFAPQNCPASPSASPFSTPIPVKPVAAWRDTKYESGPVATIPEFAAHPARNTTVTLRTFFIFSPLTSQFSSGHRKEKRPGMSQAVLLNHSQPQSCATFNRPVRALRMAATSTSVNDFRLSMIISIESGLTALLGRNVDGLASIVTFQPPLLRARTAVSDLPLTP